MAKANTNVEYLNLTTMSFIKLIDRINTIHKLISNESTGTPEELARCVGVSRATLYNLIEDLKSHDAPIEYSRSRQTFYYVKEYHLSLNYSITILENELELKKVSGGSFIFTSVHYFRRNTTKFVM